MSEYPLISVIVPCYQHAAFLGDAVDSIVGQTYPHTEIIIVNDGSPDNTREVARALIHRHARHRIKFVDKPNGGLADARNAGIEQSSGSWLLPLDADDAFEATFLGKAVSAMARSPRVNLFYTDVESFGERSGVWHPDDYSAAVLPYHNLIPGPSLYRREFWRCTGGYERALPWGAEDYCFWLGCSKIGLNPERIEGALFKYRKHAFESMFAVMMDRWPCVEGMVRTIHAELYPDTIVLNAHEAIGAMDDATAQKLDAKERCFGDLAFVRFWRGLRLEKRGEYAAALAEYDRSMRLNFKADWQPLWHMFVCQLSLGAWTEARQLLTELRGYPRPLRFVDEMLRGIRFPDGVSGIVGV